jgi:CelD/BcsL family acetyltransferase involved in cellulose biosynthesis
MSPGAGPTSAEGSAAALGPPRRRYDSPAVLDGALIDDLGDAVALYPEWDALAVTCRLPTMAPAWILGWWQHFAPAGAVPRIVTVRDRGRLVGLAPFFVEPQAGSRVDYRLPGIELAVRLAPLAHPDQQWAVADVVSQMLVQAQPRPDVVALEGLPLASHWTPALRETWPSPVRPAARCYAVRACPTISLAGHTFDSWLATRSAHLRERMRKARRRFEAAGGSHRFSTHDTLAADVSALVRLHVARWTSLGESNLATSPEATVGLLEHAGRLLLDDNRFRLIVLELEGGVVGAYVMLGAGGELLAMNGGWDERRGNFSPFLLHLSYLIEDAVARGDRRIDMGLGEQPYKRRVADGSDPVGWTMLLAPGPRMPLTAARVAPVLARYAVRDAAKRALGDDQIDRLRSLRDGRTQAGVADG